MSWIFSHHVGIPDDRSRSRTTTTSHQPRPSSVASPSSYRTLTTRSPVRPGKIHYAYNDWLILTSDSSFLRMLTICCHDFCCYHFVWGSGVRKDAVNFINSHLSSRYKLMNKTLEADGVDRGEIELRVHWKFNVKVKSETSWALMVMEKHSYGAYICSLSLSNVYLPECNDLMYLQVKEAMLKKREKESKSVFNQFSRGMSTVGKTLGMCRLRCFFPWSWESCC